MSDSDKLTTEALNDRDGLGPMVSATSIEHLSEEASKVSVSSDGSSQAESPIFQKWNNPTNLPPRINFFKFIAATRAWQRRAKKRKVTEKPPVYYENTYRMTPEKGKYFSPSKVEKLLKETLEKRLKSMKYSPDGCRITTRELCADIKRKVKEMDFPRYKIISEVLITENKRQGIQVSSRPLWNANTDNFASYTYRNATLIAVANVYGVYYE
ncbi:dynein light chain Tctex-type 5-B-like [Mercenaria mercenaria]|uniref:dynein light chain Tctex-type 5-B-like n=1 Tax=Mercenaria mercenaria TaxID=6596 RepID=UPI00234F4FAB|nr:dynein light chain Tctex-type 5-B-like [Mercenaria mercenaria]